MAYRPDRIEGFGSGGAVLSNAMPGRAEPYSAETTRIFIEGLLPEGARRATIARQLGIDPDDGYALIAELGRDCIGAVSFQPVDAPASEAEADPDAWLDEDELAELVTTPVSRLLGGNGTRRMRSVLPGDRHKLSLRREPSGVRWALPTLDSPSTHIIKPEAGDRSDLVANEMFCTTVARMAGLPAASAEVETIGGRACLVTRRFDRDREGPDVRRFHQEGFSQALGFPPGAEPGSVEAEGPRFAECSGLLRAVGEDESVTYLIAAAFGNYLFGNGDGHGKNFGLMLVDDGAVMAPLCDIASTLVYDDPVHVGMTLTDDPTEEVTLDHVEEMAEECGVGLEQCCNVAGNVAVQISKVMLEIVERSKREGWHAPVIDEVIELAARRSIDLARLADD